MTALGNSHCPGLNSGRRDWQQMPWPAEPSCLPIFEVVKVETLVETLAQCMKIEELLRERRRRQVAGPVAMVTLGPSVGVSSEAVASNFGVRPDSCSS